MAAWIRPISSAEAPVRLVCLPYAGGGSQVFGDWKQLFGDAAAVYGVDLPARGRRFNEPAVADLGVVRASISAELDLLCDRPLVLFGHSLGGALAFHIAGSDARWRRALAGVIVSATPPPGHPRSPLGDDDDHTTIRRIARYGGTPPEVLEHEGFLEMLLPALRADFCLLDRFYEQSHASLDVPLLTLAGASDPFCHPDAMIGWQSYARSGFERAVFAGDHFYIRDLPPALVAHIRGAIWAAELEIEQ